jgi:hypothetical protein
MPQDKIKKIEDMANCKKTLSCQLNLHGEQMAHHLKLAKS